MKYALEQPYGEWLEDNLTFLGDIKIPNKADIRYTDEELARLQKVFGYTYEDVNGYLKSTATDGEEPIVSMGATIHRCRFCRKRIRRCSAISSSFSLR